MKRTKKNVHGFTMIEALTAASVIGILSAVAVPKFTMMTYKAKKAERSVVMKGIEHAMFNYVLVSEPTMQSVTTTTTTTHGNGNGNNGNGNGNGSTTTTTSTTVQFNASWNPALPVTGTKRSFNKSQDGWNQLVFIPDGPVFFSYSIQSSFSATDASYFAVYAVGDLDSNGVQSQMVNRYDASRGVWQLTSQTESGDLW